MVVTPSSFGGGYQCLRGTCLSSLSIVSHLGEDVSGYVDTVTRNVVIQSWGRVMEGGSRLIGKMQ